MTEQSAVPVGRYGPPPSEQSRRRRTIAIATAGVAGLGLAVWLGIVAASAPVSWKDVGFTLDGSTSIEIDFDVIRSDPAVPVQCRVQALNDHYAQVGVVTVDIPTGGRQAERQHAVIRTSELATTAVVDRCWVVAK